MGLLDSLPLVNPDDRKRNMLADLLRGATGLLDEARPKVQDSWRNGLLSILNPEANQQRASDYLNRQNVTVGGKPYDYNQAMSDMAITGIAPLGMLAYHGSPHKFDKFSLDKIGTGEGAQAYGHGLYLAENPGVATDYAKKLSSSKVGQETGNLYKTDIPDEAVARFLDWDKPLSQQHPDIQNSIIRGSDKAKDLMSKRNALEDNLKLSDAEYTNQKQALDEEIKKYIGYIDPANQLQGIRSRRNSYEGNSLYYALTEGNRNGVNDKAASETLRSLGIPGIRYLDGGSRGAGTGTSNFVVFDPDMIRILERNGQSTGLEPWKPGEWK